MVVSEYSLGMLKKALTRNALWYEFEDELHKAIQLRQTPGAIGWAARSITNRFSFGLRPRSETLALLAKVE